MHSSPETVKSSMDGGQRWGQLGRLITLSRSFDFILSRIKLGKGFKQMDLGDKVS